MSAGTFEMVVRLVVRSAVTATLAVQLFVLYYNLDKPALDVRSMCFGLAFWTAVTLGFGAPLGYLRFRWTHGSPSRRTLVSDHGYPVWWKCIACIVLLNFLAGVVGLVWYSM